MRIVLMTEILSQIAVISKDAIEWIDNLNGVLCSVDTFEIVDKKLTFLSEKPYDILLLVDENPFLELSSFINQITRSYPLISIVVLVSNNDPDYTISLTEQGVDAVLDRQEDPSFLTRRLSHAIKRNQAKQMAIQHNRHLNSVTILSRQLHNENESNKLIIDTLNIVTATFDLMGLAIVLESGGQYHLRAGRAQNGTQQSIYDVITHLHPYDPLRHAMEKGIVMVFEDLSLNDYMVNIPIFDELHSAIVVPLRYVNITIGSLMAFGKDRNQLTRNDIVIYEHLATHLGSAYQNVRYSQTQDVSVRTNRHLLRTWQRLSPLYAPEEVNKTIKTLASEIPAVKHALAWLYDESKSLPIVHTSNLPAIQIFEKLYEQGIIGEYVNQFDTQLRPITVWLGPPSTQNIGELFQVMGGQQLIFVPIKDEARLLGCLLVSSNSNEKMSPENIDLLEGITYAAGQTLERNLFMQYQDQQTERLEAITRSIRDGIFFVDESQTIVFCNPQFTELTGINLSLVINQHIDHLIDNLVTQCDDPATARQLLDDAVQQMTNYLPDQDYPIVEISLPAIDTKLYIEFMTLTQDSNYNHQSWIGVIHSGNSLMIAEHNTPSALIGSILDHLQDTSRNIYRDLIPLNRVNTKESEKVVKQITQHGHEIEQLLIIAEKFMELEQSTHLAPSSTDPNQLLSIILNKPPLLQYDNQLDVRVALRDTQIYVDRNYMMQAMTSLIEVGISLSNSPLVLVQMGSRAQQFVFRVVSQGTATSIVSLQSALTMPDVHIEDVDYATQLRLYFVQQVIDRQDGQVVIKKSKGESIQFDILLTVEENKTDGMQRMKRLSVYPSANYQRL
jgi:PAS domain-containing protein